MLIKKEVGKTSYRRPYGSKKVTVDELIACYLDHPGEFHKFTPAGTLRPREYVNCDECKVAQHCRKMYGGDHSCIKHSRQAPAVYKAYKDYD
jgi:hypothetical protein